MTIQELLSTTAHRPWKLPSKRWKYYQEWNDVLFLHWQVELAELQKHVPKELEFDLFEGKPWVSVVPFTMEKIRPRSLPAFPPISDFHEINIRTYVRSNNKAGVYFLSIEGGSRMSCSIAKAMSELPYRHSRIERSSKRYRSSNAEFNDKLDLEYSIASELQDKTELDKWLTERYALFQDTATSINSFETHHLEWPIHELELKSLELDYPRYAKLLKNGPAKMQYSPGIKVIAWGKEKMLRSS